jgi:protease II
MVATVRLRCCDFSPLGAMLGALLCILLVGCSRDAKGSSTVKEAVELEQTANHTVIGRRDGGRLEYLDMTSNGAITTLSFSERQQVTATSIDLTKADEISSSDEKWTAHCNKNSECQISKVGDPGKTFSVSRKGILTPLYWSPDGRFVFFVRQAPNWRSPHRCSLEDERDVTVYDLTQGREEIVSTVCGGYPYGGLRWYRLTAD